MIKLIRTDAQNNDFIKLVSLLNADLAKRDGEDHAFYAQYNQLDSIKHVLVLYLDDQAVACGAIKPYDAYAMEVKRMFTHANARGKGLATMVLVELEKWTAELGYQKCKLETGIRQPEAIRLYEKNGYQMIPNYGQYADVQNSRCFEKVVN